LLRFDKRRGNRFVHAGIFILLTGIACVAQTPGNSGGPGNPGGPVNLNNLVNLNSPSTVLRDALMAACSQKAAAFSRTLTKRNAEAFERMTPAARSTLLKRFVLLDRPGEPNASGDSYTKIVVHCTTPQLTTEMQIGEAEIRENLAYVPLTVKDAADSSDIDTHNVTMGMVKESGEWKLLSLGLLLLDLPSLETEWDRAEIKSNETAALESLKKLVAAIESYRNTYTRLPDSLALLGPVAAGSVASGKGERAGLLDAALAEGRKEGYAFRYVVVGANNLGAPAKYELAAIPAEYGRAGTLSYFRDADGVLHAADHKGAVGSASDPVIK
jgi:hypothetical protein